MINGVRPLSPSNHPMDSVEVVDNSGPAERIERIEGAETCESGEEVDSAEADEGDEIIGGSSSSRIP